jgi:hypothetical protein
MALALWKDMKEPVLLEEHAGAAIPTPSPYLGSDVTESVTVEGTRPPGEGDDWEVRAYFTNPLGLGGLAGPDPAVHTGFKVYRGDKFQYSLDAGPTISLRDASAGNLRFEGKLDELEKNNAGIPRLGEFKISPPQGISGEAFARRMADAAQAYDGSLPYRRPNPVSIVDPRSFGPEVTHSFFPAGNQMPPGKFNSNSFAAAILQRAGASPDIERIQDHLKSNQWSAPGLEQPIPQRYFRNR